MQNTLPLTVGHPLRSMTGLARQISLPGESVPLRFPSFPALERTAVMGFNQPAVLQLPAATPVAIAVTRQATWPVWAERLMQYHACITYRSYIVPGGIQAPGWMEGSVNYGFGTSIRDWTMTTRAVSGDLCGFNAPSVTGLSYPLLGRDGPGCEWTYIPAGSNALITVSTYQLVSTTAVISAALNYEEWVSPGEFMRNSSNITWPASQSTATMVTYTAASNLKGRWVRPVSFVLEKASTTAIVDLSVDFDVNVVISTGTVTFNSVSTRPTYDVTSDQKRVFLPLVEPAEFANSQLPWFSTRVTAAALLGTNVSQVLNKGGSLLGGRLAPTVVNMWEATQQNIQNLHPAEKAFLALETGLYSYCPPTTDMVFFADYTLNTANGARQCPIYILSNDSLYNKFYVTATAVEEQLACTTSWHIEFRTSSALFQIGLSPMTLESLHAAQLILSELGYFFENPGHESLKQRVGRVAAKYAPLVGAAVGQPAAGAVASKVIRAVLPKEGPSKPQTTSAKSSGMLGPQKGKSKDKKKKQPKGQKKKK